VTKHVRYAPFKQSHPTHATPQNSRTLFILNEEEIRADRAVIQVMDLLDGRWTVPILCELLKGPSRLGHLKRGLHPASKKGIVTSLRKREASRVIVRRDMTRSVLHVEYEIAENVRLHLKSLIQFLAAWTIKRHQLEGAPDL